MSADIQRKINVIIILLFFGQVRWLLVFIV